MVRKRKIEVLHLLLIEEMPEVAGTDVDRKVEALRIIAGKGKLALRGSNAGWPSHASFERCYWPPSDPVRNNHPNCALKSNERWNEYSCPLETLD